MTTLKETVQELNPHSCPSQQSSSGENGTSSEFTVLSQQSLAGTLNGSFDLPLSVMTATCDLTPDEVRELIKDLLQENQDLKDSLNQNNKKMQQLLKTMNLWQEQVEQNYGNYKAIIEDLQNSISYLQGKQEKPKMVSSIQDEFPASNACSECLSLRKNIEKIKNELEAEKAKKESSTVLNCQETMCMQIKQRVVDLIKENDDLSSNYKLLEREKQDLTAMNNELQAQLSRICLEENKKDDSVVTEDIEQGYTIVYHVDENSGTNQSSNTATGSPQSLKDALIALHEECTKIDNLNKELEEEKQQVTYFKSVIERKDQHIAQLNQQLQALQSTHPALNDPASFNISALTEQGESFKDEFASSQEKMQVAFAYIQKYKERCDSLTTQLQIYQAKLEDVQASDSVIEKLQVEVAGLHTLLAQEKVNRHEDKKNLQAARLQFEQLCKDYESLMHKWNVYEKDQDTKKQQVEALKKISERQHQESLDAVTAKFVTLEEELTEKKDELAYLKSEIHKLKQETENIPILRAQVELYKQDFNAEQSARREAQDEVVKLKEEVRSLWSQKQQLLEQATSYSQVQLAHIRGSHTRNADKEGDNHHRHRHRHDEKIRNIHKEVAKSRNKSPAASLEQNHVMKCPRCALGFTNLQALENHVEMCLEDGPFC